MSRHCLHDAPYPIDAECFCCKCGNYGRTAIMIIRECTSKKKCEVCNKEKESVSASLPDSRPE